jgi:hypothetical protein
MTTIAMEFSSRGKCSVTMTEDLITITVATEFAITLVEITVAIETTVVSCIQPIAFKG